MTSSYMFFIIVSTIYDNDVKIDHALILIIAVQMFNLISKDLKLYFTMLKHIDGFINLNININLL